MLVDPNRVVSGSSANCDCVSQGDFAHNLVWFCNFGGHVVTVGTVIIIIIIIIIAVV
jgi:hypothetical protein